MDLDAGRLEVAKKLGATATINPAKREVPAAILALTQGSGPDIVFEAAGPPKTASLAIHLMKRRGRVVMIGLPPEDNFPYPLVAAMAKETDIMTVFWYANAILRR